MARSVKTYGTVQEILARLESVKGQIAGLNEVKANLMAQLQVRSNEVPTAIRPGTAGPVLGKK